MDAAGRELLAAAQGRADGVAAAYEARDFCRAMVEIRALADQANQYFDAQAPWALVKRDPEAARAVLTSTLNLFRVLAIYLKPILPGYAAKVETLFGEPPYGWADSATRFENRPVGAYAYLATRMEKEQVEKMIAESLPEAKAETTPAAKPATPLPMPLAVPAESPAEFDIDAFLRVDLRVARVLTAACVEGADKLLKLTLDAGESKPRQVFAGIRKAYDPATLIGRNVILVANLKPRKMRFGVSEGMVLAAGNADGALFLVSPDDGAEPGARVK
jgi:methionyl-tRNA synthetase